MSDPSWYDPELRALLKEVGLAKQGRPRPAPAPRSGAQALAWQARRIGRMIATRRRAMGLSQLQLAYEVGTSQSAISRVERGHYRVSLYTLNRIAWALGSQLVVGLFDLDADVPSGKLVGAPPARGHYTRNALG